MRKKLVFLVMAVVLLSAPALEAQWRFNNPCRTFYCYYSIDTAECKSSSFGMGQWVDCHVDSNCIWDYDGGWSWTCRPECHGSDCLEV